MEWRDEWHVRIYIYLYELHLVSTNKVSAATGSSEIRTRTKNSAPSSGTTAVQYQVVKSSTGAKRQHFCP